MEDHGTAVLERPRENSGLGRRLGRGLNALLGGGPEQGDGGHDVAEHVLPERIAESATVAEIRVDAIDPNPFQPRKHFSAESLEELGASIRQHGVLQSLLVRPCHGRFELIAGERRLLAAKQAGLEKVPCRILELVDHEVAEAALEENMKRADLNPLEKARAFKEYLDRFGSTIEELAGHLSMKRATVSNFLRLLDLPEAVRKLVETESLTNGHARALLSLDEAMQVAFAKRIVKEEWSVRRTESEVRAHLQAGMGDAEDAASAPHEAVHPAAHEATGDGHGEPTGEAGEAAVNHHLQSLQDGLRDHLGTTVEIKQTGKETGRFVIHFESNDEFERLLGMLRAA